MTCRFYLVTYLLVFLLAACVQGIEIIPDEVLVDSALTRIQANMQGSGAHKDYGALYVPVLTFLCEDIKLNNSWATGECYFGGCSKPAPKKTIDALVGCWADVSYSISDTDKKYEGTRVYQRVSTTSEAKIYFMIDAHPSWLGWLTGQKTVYLDIKAAHEFFLIKSDPDNIDLTGIVGLAISKKGMKPGVWVSGIALRRTYNRTENGTEPIIEVANEAGNIGFTHDIDDGDEEKGSVILSDVPIIIGEEYQMSIWAGASSFVSMSYDPGAKDEEARVTSGIDPKIILNPQTPDPGGLTMLVSSNLYYRNPDQPDMKVTISQDGEMTENPVQEKGPVTIRVEFEDQESDSKAKYFWSDNYGLKDINGPQDDEFIFDPKNLELGNYTIGVMGVHEKLGSSTEDITIPIGRKTEPIPESLIIVIGTLPLIIRKNRDTKI